MVGRFYSCRGKSRLVSPHNHIFNKKITLKSGHIVWQCSIRNKSTYCSAVVKQLGDVFEPGPKSHVCVIKASALAGAKVRAQINIQGKSDVFDFFDFIECFTTTFLRAHSWLNWVGEIRCHQFCCKCVPASTWGTLTEKCSHRSIATTELTRTKMQSTST